MSTWTCHACGYGGMSVSNNVHCPNCGHPRCTFCTEEKSEEEASLSDGWTYDNRANYHQHHYDSHAYNNQGYHRGSSGRYRQQ